MCCSVLQCVAVCVAVCCSQPGAILYVLQCVAVCCIWLGSQYMCNMTNTHVRHDASKKCDRTRATRPNTHKHTHKHTHTHTHVEFPPL